jgi:hypothetical protein
LEDSQKILYRSLSLKFNFDVLEILTLVIWRPCRDWESSYSVNSSGAYGGSVDNNFCDPKFCCAGDWFFKDKEIGSICEAIRAPQIRHHHEIEYSGAFFKGTTKTEAGVRVWRFTVCCHMCREGR